MTKNKSRILVMLFLSISLALVWADEMVSSYDDLSLSSLLSLALETGSFLDLDLMKSPLSMTVIKKEDVNSSGARHLSELLEIYVPGFQYMYNKWNGEIWGMRGVAADRNTKFIFLVNGHKMNHESRDGAMSEINLGLFGDVERVEVLRGPAGLVYGSGAIAGIVNIVTKRYETDQTVVRGGLGTWDFDGTSKEIGVDVYQGFDDNQSLVVSLGYRQSDGLKPEEARLWGRPHWPYPQWLGNNGYESVPSAGCAWCTPGNWKVGIDYQWDNLRLYTRVTHQVANAGGQFIVDPWPDIAGNETSEARLVEGKWVNAGEMGDISKTPVEKIMNIDGKEVVFIDTIYDTTWNGGWWQETESWGGNRRQYQIDNIMSELSYNLDIGANELKLKAGFDAVTNRILLEERKGYETLAGEERNSFVEETFGERRYSLGASFMLKSIDKLQAAVGYELRVDDIGNDLMGRNEQKEMPLHKIVSDVLYTNNAFFGEALYEMNPKLFVHGGLRYDIHTRTKDIGGVLSPKLALITLPSENHAIKLIFQTSANNGSADNYEYNRNNFDDNGDAYDGYHFEKPAERPGGNSTPIPGVKESDLHKLKPERVQSLELTSVHNFGVATVQPSISYNKVKDLFTWNQEEFRVINSGNYEFVNAEIDVGADWKNIRVGASHAYQVLVNMDLEKQDHTSYQDEFDTDGVFWEEYEEHGMTRYRPVPTGEKIEVTSNAIKDQITVDGKHFMNLNTHVSKLYMDLRLLSDFSFHTDLRVFYALKGRRPLVEKEPDFNYLRAHLDPMVKWNMGLQWHAAENLRVSVYAYDLLATRDGKNAIHSLRWQQVGNSDEHTDLFGIDRRSFGIQVEKTF
ncbi:MAG: TonB-dependent receptor [Fibrobacter sp.]|nr:TonB-dependent receptor [Fibrobacter sp.]